MRWGAGGGCWLRRGAWYGRSDAAAGNYWVKLGLCAGGESPRQARRDQRAPGDAGDGVLHLGFKS